MAADSVNQLDVVEPRWFAVRTRAKCEKFAQRLLTKKGIEAYVPLQQLVRRYARKLRRVEVPLIHAYVFVHIVKDQYVPVLETEHVAGFVKIAQQLYAIPEAEIDLLRRVVLEKDLEVEAVPGRLASGDAVEIIAGSLVGVKGRLLKAEEGRRQVQVELDTIGYSLLVTLEAEWLRKI